MNSGNYSVPALAYLGDSVFEITVRRHLVLNGISSSVELNRRALSFVTAAKQCEAIDKILPVLNEDELSLFKRGKNHKNGYHPKSVDLESYRKATGLEVLFAVLYLDGKNERIEELFEIGFPDEKNEK